MVRLLAGVSCVLVGAGCTRAAVETGGPAPSAVLAPSASREPVGAPAPSAPAPASYEGPSPSPWIEACEAWLSGARRAASAVEPGLAGAFVEHEVGTPADGRAREVVKLMALPPVHPTGGLFVRIERPASTSRAAAEWQRHAESLHGGYHALFIRSFPGGEATIAFDGWASARVDALAPYFQAAAERCMAP